MNHENDPLESLIDRALESYTPREQRPGLEYRILATATVERAPWFFRWKPVWTLALAALLLLAAVPAWLRFMQPGSRAAERPAIVAAGHLPEPASGSQANSGSARKSRNFVSRHASGELKAEVHARPAGGAAEESLAAEPIELKPITIAPIQIRALN
jgi:hypothetical protein